MRTIPEIKEGTSRLKASGVLPNGKPVIINADGTVSVVKSNATGTSVSTRVPPSTSSDDTKGVYDTNSKRIVVSYRDAGNSSRGAAVVGTVTNDSITFGTPVTYNSNGNTRLSASVFDSNSNKVIITYRDGGNQNYGTAIVGTVDPSNNSISFGTAHVFWTASNFEGADLTFDTSANKVIMFFAADNGSGALGKCCTLTVNGTSISNGTITNVATNMSANDNEFSDIVYDSNADRSVVCYMNSDNGNYGTANVITVSGTDVSAGTAVVYNSAQTVFSTLCFDPVANKVVVGYRDDQVDNRANARVGTISNTSISFGTETQVFPTLAWGSARLSYDVPSGKILFFSRQVEAYVNIGTISGTDISFESRFKWDDGEPASMTTAYNPDLNRTMLFVSFESKSFASIFRVADANITSENYVGISGGVVDITGSAGGTGSETVFEAATSRYGASAYDTNANRVVIAYADVGNSSYGTAIVGTVSGFNISFGSPVVFETAEVQDVAITFDSNSNKIVIAYADEGNSSHGTAIVGTVSGTAISFGSAVVFEAANSDNIAVTFDSNSNKVVIAYSDLGNSRYGTSIVGTVSGTSISFGTAVVFESADSRNIESQFDPNSNKVVIVYRDIGNSQYGTAIIGTVSGTGISFGTAVVFLAGASKDMNRPVIDSTNNKVIISYSNGGNSTKAEARVGTVSGTGISFGTAVVFSSGTAEFYTGGAYHAGIQKVVLAYRDDTSNTLTGKYNVGTVSGTDISFSGEVIFNAGRSDNISLVYDPDSENLVNSFEDNANSSHGTSIVFTPNTVVITRGEVASGSHAPVDIVGSVSTNQTGLTPGQSYFVQNDGTLNETAASPSVFAGTALSATKLLVKI